MILAAELTPVGIERVAFEEVEHSPISSVFDLSEDTRGLSQEDSSQSQGKSRGSGGGPARFVPSFICGVGRASWQFPRVLRGRCSERSPQCKEISLWGRFFARFH